MKRLLAFLLMLPACLMAEPQWDYVVIPHGSNPTSYFRGSSLVASDFVAVASNNNYSTGTTQSFDTVTLNRAYIYGGTPGLEMTTNGAFGAVTNSVLEGWELTGSVSWNGAPIGIISTSGDGYSFSPTNSMSIQPGLKYRVILDYAVTWVEEPIGLYPCTVSFGGNSIVVTNTPPDMSQHVWTNDFTAVSTNGLTVTGDNLTPIVFSMASVKQLYGGVYGGDYDGGIWRGDVFIGDQEITPSKMAAWDNSIDSVTGPGMSTEGGAVTFSTNGWSFGGGGGSTTNQFAERIFTNAPMNIWGRAGVVSSNEGGTQFMQSAYGCVYVTSTVSGNAGTFYSLMLGNETRTNWPIDSRTTFGATYFSVAASGIQPITNAAWRLKTYGTEFQDYGNNFTNNAYTVPVTGTYLFNVGTYWQSLANGINLHTRIFTNGVMAASLCFNVSTTASTVDLWQTGSLEVYCSSGMVITVYVYQSSGATYNVYGDGTLSGCRLSGYRLY